MTRDSARTVPEPVPEHAITDTRHPDTPTSDIRYPYPTTANVPRVFSYSVLAFPCLPLGISDLWLNLYLALMDPPRQLSAGILCLMYYICYLARILPVAPTVPYGTVNNMSYTLLVTPRVSCPDVSLMSQ